MKNKFNVIQIKGFTGIFIAIFLIGCLIEGAIFFPSKMLMHSWNYIAQFVYNMPTMTLLHGVILWAIIALSAFALLKDKKPISYESPSMSMITDADIKKILEQTQNFENIKPVQKEEKEETEIKQ